MIRENPNEVSQCVMEDLESVSAPCDVYHRGGHKLHRFWVEHTDKVCVLNQPVSIDLMTLEGESVLNIVDNDTKFWTEGFLDGE